MASEVAPARIEPTAKWIRAYQGDRVVVDSKAVVLVWTRPHYPTWFFPLADVDAEFAADHAAAVSTHPGLPDHVSIAWDAADRWLEEEVEVIVHPRDPYTRIDALPSSRHVVVTIDGTVVAESRRPTILYETGLRPRYYLPAADVRFELLTPTAKSTACPYKGVATYWTASVDGVDHADVAWCYPDPLPESLPIAGLICFYDERVDLAVS